MMKAEGVVIIVVIGIVIVMAVGWWFWGENVQLVTGGSFSPTTVTTINPNSVSLALGDILLFKTPAGELGAIRFDAMTDDWGADYTAWFARAGSTGPPVESHGHVYEKYWQTRGRDGHHVKDAEETGRSSAALSESSGPHRRGFTFQMDTRLRLHRRLFPISTLLM